MSFARRLRRNMKGSGMRYLIIPEPVEIVAVQRDGRALIYSNRDFHQEYVWPAPEWRDGTRDAAERFAACYSKIHAAKPGDVVGLTDEEYETYSPIATMRGKPIPPPLAVEFNQLMRPILLATKERPKPEPPSESATAASDGAPDAPSAN